MGGNEWENLCLDGETKESNCTDNNEIEALLCAFNSMTEVVVRIPIELVSDILSRLPIEDIIRCRSVSKGWCALTKTPHFIQRHLRRALSIHHRILLEPTNKGPVTSLYLIDRDGGKWKVDCKNDSCLDGPSPCCAITRKSEVDPLFIYNPITRECKELPKTDLKPEKAYISVGFGFDPRSKKYKVARIFKVCDAGNLQPYMKCQIITLGEESWREVEVSHKVVCCRNEKPILLDGALHWRIDHRSNPGCEYILVLDLYNEKFRTIKFPSSICQSLTLAKLVFMFSSGGSLCLVQHDTMERFHLWRIERVNTKKGYKFYGSSVTMVTGYQKVICSIYLKDKMIENSLLFHVITRLNLREMKREKDHLSMYFLETKEYKILEVSGIPDFFQPNLFVPTLVSPSDAFGKGAQEVNLS